MNRLSALAAVLTLAIAGCAMDRGSNQRIADLRERAPLPAKDVDTTQARDQAMHHYERFLRESPASPLAGEALRRLADLNLEYEQQLRGDGHEQPNATPSKAAALYRELLERFPERSDAHASLYQLARAYDLSGEPEPAMQALETYATRHPSGDKIDEVEFRRGEYLFVRRDFVHAEQAYASVADLGEDSTFYRHSLYKLGWSRFKLQEFEQSLVAFMQLLDASLGKHTDNPELPDSIEGAERERLEDTLRAISLDFVALGDEKQLGLFFSRHGQRGYEALIHDRLAALHLSRERYSDAALTYNDFANRHPDHQQAPIFQSNVIDIYRQAGFHTRVLEEKQAYVERYVPSAAYWEIHDIENSAPVLAQVRRHLRDISRHYHADAQKNRKAESFRAASHWYRLFLASFPDSEQTPYMNFLYAELLASGSDHAGAARQYERTAYSYGDHDKAAEAGYAALLAYTRHEKTLTGADRSSWHIAGIDSALRFAEAFPAHQHALNVRLKASEQLYALHRYNDAVAAAEPVVHRKDATDRQALDAWTVIAHSRFDLRDYEAAEHAYQQVLEGHSGKPEQAAAFREKLAASIYKQGELARAAGDNDSAARHFLRVSRNAPGSGINATARYDAAAAFIALEKWPEAISVLEAWRSAYPGHKMQDDVTRKLAVLYRENDQPLSAAIEFERLAGLEADPEIRREAAWTSAGLYEQAGESGRAIESYRRYVSGYPMPLEAAMEARLKLVQLFEKDGNPRMLRHWQQEIVKADASAGAARTDRTRFLAAHASLALVDEHASAYRNAVLREPLKKNLAVKKKYMQAAIDGYTRSAAYGVTPVTTEATFRIAEIYRDFGEALLDSERPANLDGEELEQYEILLEEQAYPFEEQAIEVYETNIRRLADGNYDRWIRKSLARLADLLPVRYAKHERSETFVISLHQ